MDRWNGKHGKQVNIDAVIAQKKAESADFRRAYDAQEEAHGVALELVKLRRLRGVSQVALAKLLRTSQAAISRAERPDYRGHTWKVITSIAAALGATPVLTFKLTAPPTAPFPLGRTTQRAVAAEKRQRKHRNSGAHVRP